MNVTLHKIVARELKKLNDLSERDEGILAPNHLDALEGLARILKSAPAADDDAPAGEMDVAAALKLAGG